MIDNRLKNCCNDCNHIDAFADTRSESYRTVVDRSTMHTRVNVLIGCKHMYVCKKYIENQEVEG